jgi:hypothetical protein
MGFASVTVVSFLGQGSEFFRPIYQTGAKEYLKVSDIRGMALALRKLALCERITPAKRSNPWE